VRFEVHDLAIAGDEGHRARDVMRVDVALNHLVDARKTFGREADLFGFYGVDRRREHR
jgi:hypothetical protein